MMRRYVQHISGQGEKWEVRPCSHNDGTLTTQSSWLVEAKEHSGCPFYLPKSEYMFCVQPPEHWVDVTADIMTSADNDLIYNGYVIYLPYRWNNANGYRFRKIQLHEELLHDVAFIVEEKKHP